MQAKSLKVTYVSSESKKSHTVEHRVWDQKRFIDSLHKQQADLKKDGKEFFFLEVHAK